MALIHKEELIKKVEFNKNIIFKKIKKYFLELPCIELVKFWPSYFNFKIMKKINGIRLPENQLKIIATTIKKKTPCKLLIFGLGNDSVFWSRLNPSGVTIFLESNDKWMKIIAEGSKDITAFLIKYNTKRTDWKMLLENPSLLNMPLPKAVENEKWDIILVDGPAGNYDCHTGRMKSIFAASRLVKNSSDVFVHDCNREIEDIYCNIFLKEKNFKMEDQASVGNLRHYHMT